MQITLRNTLTTYIRGLVQYDYGQHLELFNTGITDENFNIQFIQNGKEIDQLAEKIDDHFVVMVPDSFLKNPDEITAFLYVEDEDKGNTEKVIVLDVLDREKFSPIPDEQEEHILAEILSKLNYLQDKIDNFELTEEQLASVVTQVIVFLDNNIYTKAETDAAISAAIETIDLSNYATKSELQEVKNLVVAANTILGGV